MKKEKSLAIALCDLTPNEKELIDCYRKSDDRGKRTILSIAQMQKQQSEIIYFEERANRNR